jgi:hypothetical protein
MRATTRLGLIIGSVLAAAAAAAAGYGLSYFTGNPVETVQEAIADPSTLLPLDQALFTGASLVGWLAAAALLFWALRVAIVAVTAKSAPVTRGKVRPSLMPETTAAPNIERMGPTVEAEAAARRPNPLTAVFGTLSTLLFRGGVSAVKAAQDRVHMPGTVTFEANPRSADHDS